ncbi:GDSL-type esterase/lipase family protein [Lentiprolixibacter aurantiacus]|uniref:GDSL-type esterase/lipase family protein n=1 Tax=Lentiprolixibacter aurantiacus TaxID=2993939 RepID=A0AAE3MMJ0_9FLAO|nr:GDSL-type esterase/lipase family protein [Lentiprolixibacter aurantiacus]MCX2720461.1 GDSL-type esterase/lipase family protein [Lentiprolixibacter aurantiacus]
MAKASVILLLSFLLTSAGARPQDPERFRKEVEKLVKRNDSLWDSTKETIVFTGSSSIKTWESLQSDFPSRQIINSGFGGSHASDLIAYTDQLVLRYKPSKVFIYEGDNDLSERKRPGKILKDINKILSKIWLANPNTEVILISAKPSISRWHRKGAFRRLNRRFKRLADRQPGLYFADVWTAMLSGKKLKKDLYIEDGLHINEKGYQIWKNVIDPYVN